MQGKRRGRPKVTRAHVAEHAAGLHALTGPASGELASHLRAGRESDARASLERWRELFPDKTLSIEVQLHHAGGREAALAGELIELAESSGVPWVATQDPRYLDDRGRLVHDLLTALRYDLTVDVAAERGLLHPNGEWRLLSPAEMARRWAGPRSGTARERAHRRRVRALHARLDAPAAPRLSQSEARRRHVARRRRSRVARADV